MDVSAAGSAAPAGKSYIASNKLAENFDTFLTLLTAIIVNT
jgi:hypothetical protein